MHPLLLSAIIAAITGGIAVALRIIIPKYIDKIFDHRFEMKMEKYRNELAEQLEHEKTDLAVWFELRKDILLEMWGHHKTITKEMTGVILAVQAIEFHGKTDADLKKSVELFRALVHQCLGLISDEGIDICQRFLDEARTPSVSAGKQPDQKLKEIRNEFREYSSQTFGIKNMMPKMAGKT
ncbi:MAG TPA: hypothetical protein VK826_10980 [Bacteroidia bacterium]|nr:hypothetical protein [Bacteroidia bacterium]